MEVQCYHCQAKLSLASGQDIGRSEECPKCFTSLRCCRMCGFYDKNAYNECSEPMAERILDKEKANFCDYYKLGEKGSENNAKNDALAKANALFKK